MESDNNDRYGNKDHKAVEEYYTENSSMKSENIERNKKEFQF